MSYLCLGQHEDLWALNYLVTIYTVVLKKNLYRAFLPVSCFKGSLTPETTELQSSYVQKTFSTHNSCEMQLCLVLVKDGTE